MYGLYRLYLTTFVLCVRHRSLGVTGVSIQPFQTPPMARPRFHSHTDSLMRSNNTQSSALGLQNFNLQPVKDTNGRNGNTTTTTTTKKIITATTTTTTAGVAIEEDDIIPVKEVAAVSPVSTTVAASSASLLPPSKSSALTAEKDVIILDKDFDDRIKSEFYSFICTKWFCCYLIDTLWIG